MDFKDYYAALGVAADASRDDIKRAYRKLARRYHPDVSQESNAEARFKEVAEAHEALIDPERRAAYDALALRHRRGEDLGPSPGWAERSTGGAADGFDAQDFTRHFDQQGEYSDFFDSLFGRGAGRPRGGPARPDPNRPTPGEDLHARVEITLAEAYAGARRHLSLAVPVIGADGRPAVQDRQLEVQIPPGISSGQHLRLAGQGGPGQAGGAAGDLYLEVSLRPDPRFRVDGRDVHVELSLSPWEAALGASVPAQTPQGEVQLTIPPGSTAGRQLRLKGRGLPGKTAGDLYAVLAIRLPAADSAAAQAAYQALAAAFPHFDPRIPQESPP